MASKFLIHRKIRYGPCRKTFCFLVLTFALTSFVTSSSIAADPQDTSTTTANSAPTTPKKSSSKKKSGAGVSLRPSPRVDARYQADNRDRWDKKWGPLVPHKTFPKKCDICHIPKRWDVLRPDFHFDHKKETGFALEGAHATIACLNCHNDRMASSGSISRGCSACHTDPHKGSFGLDCQRCHNQVNFTPMQTALELHARTRFPLTGVHATLICIQCHLRADVKDFSGAPVDCIGCHQPDYNKAPNHVAMGFAKTCLDCHTTTSFAGAFFDHSKLGPNPNCYNCHQADYEAANNPKHVGVMPTTCNTCHTTTSWSMSSGGSGFDHASTGFPLTAKHATATCVTCHVNNNFSLPNANCLPCHNTDFGTGSYVTASAPGATPVQHDPTNYPSANCINCHGGFDSWVNGAAHVHTLALTGAHNTACNTCHNATLGQTHSDWTCSQCHQTNDTGHGSYNNAKTPLNHTAQNMPIAQCQTCHGDLTSWTSGKFPNHATTGFALTASHVSKVTACTDCHDQTPYTSNGGKISGTSCVPCHQTDYNFASTAAGAASVPNGILHTAGAEPVASCSSCHGSFDAWQNATAFDHTTLGPNFPWKGAHSSASCDSCHALAGVTLTGNTLTVTCASCHQSINTGQGSYNTATTPVPHKAQNMPIAQCQTCHGDVTSWTNGTFTNHSTTGFALTAKHATAACTDCHDKTPYTSNGGKISGTSCIPCHQPDYNFASTAAGAASVPNGITHTAAAEPPATCSSCHGGYDAWANGTGFDHTTLGANFPWKGAHSAASCDSCHALAGVTLTGNTLTVTCASCHQSINTGQGSYNTATTPAPHSTTNMPVAQCQTCHGDVTSWTNGTFTNHGTTGFALTAKHATAACTDCHDQVPYTNNGGKINGTSCTPCHTPDYNFASTPAGAASVPNGILHTLAAEPPASCSSCHGGFDAWQNATGFDHTTLGPNFPWKGAHSAASCDSCHALAGVTLTGNTLTVTCASCHQSINTGNGSYNTATTPVPHKAANMPIAQCQTCHGDVTSWTNGTFTNHSTTGFALTAKHATAACTDCHDKTPYTSNGGKISGTSCIPCHQPDYNFASTAAGAASVPNGITHTAAAEPPASCSSCHGGFDAWQNGTGFDHTTLGANFPWKGAHSAASCDSCHALAGVTLTGNTLTVTCASCHQSINTGNGSYNTATTPVPHKAANMPIAQCQTCHGDVTAWINGTFTNHGTTGFALTAKHATAACTDCHDQLPYTSNGGKISGTSCIPCHQPDYNFASTAAGAASVPNGITHTAASEPPATCVSCHGGFDAWQNGTGFDHTTLGAGFPWKGAHSAASCDSCHALAGVTLSGNTLTVTCASCHQTINTGNGSYNTATTPVPHTAANMPVASCQTCHGDVTSWTNGTFTNHATTGFTLTGKHATAACATCHSAANGNYTIANANCVPCHNTNYGTGSYPTTSPSHTAMGWTNTTPACTQCHSDYNNWQTGITNAAPLHSSFTGGWALIGAHLDSGRTNAGGVVSSCVGCHANSNSYISGTNCVPCHQADYTQASLPSATIVHDPSNYPTASCASCHGDYVAWTNGVGFDHAKVGFALTGLHNTACANCHNSALGQTHSGHACAMCHQNYDTGHGSWANASKPIVHNDSRVPLPLTCDNCHSYATAWTTTISPHPTGNCKDGTGGTTPWQHQNVQSCSDCHTKVTSMSVADGTFSCALCHSGHHSKTPAGTCGN